MVQSTVVSFQATEGRVSPLPMELHRSLVAARVKFKYQLDLLPPSETILFQPMVPSSAGFIT